LTELLKNKKWTDFWDAV